MALWPTLGLTLAGYGLRRTGIVRRDCLLTAGVLVIFGASDWFEANTHNEWWRPWWLFLWKAACVLALLAVTVNAYRRRGRPAAARNYPSSEPVTDTGPRCEERPNPLEPRT